MLPTTTTGPQPEPKKSRWRKWLKWTGIGCASWVGMMLVLGIIASIFTPASPPHAPIPKPGTKDTVAAVVVADSSMPVSATLAIPLASPALDVAPKISIEPPVPAPPKLEQKEVTVYTTSTGSKYHRSSCSSLRKSSYAISLSEAKAASYEPCRRCHPPN